MTGDDITPLFRPAAAGPSQPMTYRQGTVLEFDRVTLRNKVSVGGAVFADLPVLGVAEAASLSAGSVVGIMAVESTWAIIGRLVIPGTAEATDAITQLSQSIVSQQINTVVGTTSVPYVDLGGPSVSVRVRASGSLLVILSAEVQATKEIGIMGFVLSGANTQAAADGDALYVYTENVFADLGTSRVVQVNGLAPGVTTVAARYHIGGIGPIGSSVAWANRAIVAFAL